MRFGWLSGRHHSKSQPSIPAPRTVTSRSTLSRLVALPETGPGWHNAVVKLEDTLSAWSLPVSLARRWMQPTRDLFTADPPAELFVQYDRLDGTVDIELWDQQGDKLFGVDAYLGAPEAMSLTVDRRVPAN